jgi:hypothetical protein
MSVRKSKLPLANVIFPVYTWFVIVYTCIKASWYTGRYPA